MPLLFASDPFVPVFRMGGRTLMVLLACTSGPAVFVGRPYCRFLARMGRCSLLPSLPSDGCASLTVPNAGCARLLAHSARCANRRAAADSRSWGKSAAFGAAAGDVAGACSGRWIPRDQDQHNRSRMHPTVSWPSGSLPCAMNRENRYLSPDDLAMDRARQTDSG